MANQGPVGWLSTKAKAGLKDLPSNTAWVLSKALQPAKPTFEDISEGASAATDSVGAGAAEQQVPPDVLASGPSALRQGRG